MKTTRFLNKLLAVGLVIFVFGCLLATPGPAHAETLGTLGDILDLIHPFDPQVIPSGSDLTTLMPLLMDVVNDPEHAPDYIVKYSDALQGNEYGETIVMVAQIYVDVENKDVWGIVGVVAKWLGDDAPCIIAGIVLPGVGGELCALVKAVVEFLADVGEAIVEFFKDLGHAIVCAFKKCCIGGLTVYNGTNGYKNYENDGLKWREDPSQDMFWPKEVQLSNWVCDANPDACLMDLQEAQDAFITIVNKKWDADMSTRVLPNIVAPARNSYNTPSKVANLAAQAAAATASAGGDAGKWIIDRCKSDFSQYAYFDRWVKDTSNKFQAGTNVSWCANTFWGKNKAVFAEKFGDYVNQNLCPGYLCKTVANFRACANLESSVYGSTKWHCQIDTISMGKDLAPVINTMLHQPIPNGDGSLIPCTVDKNSVICQRGTQKYFCEKHYESLVLGNLNFIAADLQKQPLVNCMFVEQGNYKATHDKLTALVTNPGSAFFGIVPDKIDPFRVVYIHMPIPGGNTNVADLQLLGKLQKDPAYQALGFKTKNCTLGNYSVDGEPTPTICQSQSKPYVTTPGGSPKDKLKQEYEKLKHPGPDPRLINPDPGNELPVSKYDGKLLKSGDALKVINGQLFIQTKAGARTAVGNQIMELMDGTSISVKGGKTAQVLKPGTNLKR
jgi:hypothetical protein